MGRTFVVLTTLVAAYVAISARAAEPVERSPWDGYAVGSWALYRTTFKTTEAGKVPIDTARDSRVTLERATERAYKIKLESKDGEAWTPCEQEVPRVVDPKSENPDEKIEDLGKETLKFDGVSVECRKVRRGTGTTSFVTWSSAEWGTLKSERIGGARPDTTFVLTKWIVPLKVKGKDVNSRSYKKTEWWSPKQESTRLSWESDSIPGGLVRREESVKMEDGSTISSVTEVTDFERT